MTRIRIALVAAAAAALVLAIPVAAKSPTKLVGTVGPGFTISLKTMAGAKVKTLPAGLYMFVVTDKASIHNFHLSGSGVNKEITGVGFTGTKSVTLTLKKGKYTFVCDPHSSSMNGAFTII